MAKSHSASRSAAQWVEWASSENMPDIIEDAHEAGEHASFSFFPHFYLCLGKVYCVLCAKSLVPSASSLRQHCFGYYKGTGENRKFIESDHLKKAKKRKEREDAKVQHRPENAVPQNIVIQVFLSFFFDVSVLDSAGSNPSASCTGGATSRPKEKKLGNFGPVCFEGQ